VKVILRIGLLGVLICAAWAAAAWASPYQPASGTWAATGQTGDGCFVLSLDGTFAGTGILCPEDANGKVNYIHFTGVVGDRRGTALFKDVDFRPNGKELFTLKDGTGGLEGLHGQGVVRAYDPANPYAGTYEGRIHFDPR